MIIDLLLKKLRGELYYSIRDYMTLNILCNRRNNDFENGLKNGVEFLYLFFKSKQHLISKYAKHILLHHHLYFPRTGDFSENLFIRHWIQNRILCVMTAR